MLEFYLDKFSYNSTEEINIFINNESEEDLCKITILNFKNEVLKYYEESCGFQKNHKLCFAEGCNWKVNKKISLSQINFDINLPNINFIKIENKKEEFYVPFVIKRLENNFAIICNTNTWCAYNSYGGASFYTPPHKNIVEQNKYFETNINNNVGTICSSFKRPNYTISNGIKIFFKNIEFGRDHLFGGESILWKFLNNNNYKFDLVIDSDLENIGNIIDRTIIFLNCHPEYWSHKMLYNLNVAMQNNTNLIYLGGNGIWRKVILKEDRIEKIGYPYCNNILN